MVIQQDRGLEYALGKGLMQPFANTNSGTRKLMYSVHLEQALRLLKPEVPIIQTGYEIRYGDLSSAIVKAESDFEVVAKVSKFENMPNHHYYLIVKRHDNGQYDVIERKSYNHITETFGYLYNNTILDNLDIGYEVPANEILRTTYSYDEYMNRCDGVNLMAGYISSDKDMEDGIVISESTVKKLGSPLVKKVTIFIGENDILLNVNGKDGEMKTIPDIGEEVSNSILCAIRKEKIEECLYMQSVDRLSQILMSDDKFPVDGKVIDIDVFSNKPETLSERHTNHQILHYYNEHVRFNKELIKTIDSFKDPDGNINMSYDLEVLYYNAVYETVEGMPFEENKKYDGTIFRIYLLEENTPMVGDKITNRYGGKGVISYIVPDDEMPLLDNGKRLDLYFNSCTCVNRLNQGQLDEMSLTFIGERILDYIATYESNWDIAIDMVCKYVSLVSEKQGAKLRQLLYEAPDFEREEFIHGLIQDEFILLSIKPISESMTLDKLAAIYKEFPFISQYSTVSKMLDSNGKPRYVRGRRKIVAGKMYIYRLKQYAEEKFSATSLSSTNLTNENTKSKASKNYMAAYANTPIRFGEMEAEDERHMGTMTVVKNLMIHSTSPQARRLAEACIEGDPYTIDIQLDGTCKSRSAEKAKVYLKAMGIRVGFYKKLKKKKKLFSVATPQALPGQKYKLFSHDHPDENSGSAEEWMEKLEAKDKSRIKRLFRKTLFEHIEKKEE